MLLSLLFLFFFFFNDTATTEIYTLSLHDALPIYFPPISLPKREYMERAKEIWEELGLPKLKPESPWYGYSRSEEHTSELQSRLHLVCRLLLEKKKKKKTTTK